MEFITVHPKIVTNRFHKQRRFESLTVLKENG